MNEFMKSWFEWFGDGMAALSADARAKFFGHCGEMCARTGVIEKYKALFKDSNCDADAFFGRLSDIDEVAGRVVVPGREYEISFMRCLCDLHTEGLTGNPVICECSKGSIEYVMRELMPDRKIEVNRIHTILGGAKECRFQVIFPDR